MKLFKKDLTAGQIIFKYMFSFVVLMLVVLWLLHIVLLDHVYIAIKKREITSVSSTVAANLETKELPDLLEYIIDQRNISVAVIDSSRNIIAGNTEFSFPFIDGKINEDTYRRIYESAEKSDGITVEITHPARGRLPSADKEYESVDRIAKEHPVMKRREAESLLYVQIAKGDSGKEYLILNSCVISPVDATVDTLKAELFFIAFILVALVALIAFRISRRVTTPIHRMNEAAKILATGNYDINFKADGFKEIKELGSTLNYAASELSKTERLRQELIANVSHDLRTPLTMISGYAEVMHDIPGEYTPENVRIILDESKRLTELVNDMMDMSKLQAGATELRIDAFNITSLIKTIINRYANVCSKYACQVEFEYEEETVALGDELQISRVIYNLLNNAVRYCGDDRLIIIRQTILSDEIKIEVIDHGQGIEESDIPYIWDKYFKSNSVHKRAVVGTGLGLSIVKGILELHKAKFGVESQKGEGSDFWFVLKRD